MAIDVVAGRTDGRPDQGELVVLHAGQPAEGSFVLVVRLVEGPPLCAVGVRSRLAGPGPPGHGAGASFSTRALAPAERPTRAPRCEWSGPPPTRSRLAELGLEQRRPKPATACFTTLDGDPGQREGGFQSTTRRGPWARTATNAAGSPSGVRRLGAWPAPTPTRRSTAGRARSAPPSFTDQRRPPCTRWRSPDQTGTHAVSSRSFPIAGFWLSLEQ